MTRATLLAFALAAASLGPAIASAQDRPVVFMHGFGAAAADWAATADRLKASVALEPHIPELRWRETYGTQADGVQSQNEYSLLPDNTVAVGHSNGGIVAREWSKRHRLAGIVTIGTPHRGAPIFGQLLRWTFFSNTSQSALNAVVSAFSRWSDWTWVYYFVDEAVRWLSDFNFWSLVNLAGTLGLNAALPVGYEVLPDSPYLSGLNSGANLAREAADAPNRVGIISVAHNFYFAGPARAIAPDHADLIATGMYGAAFSLLFWGNYVLVSSPISDWVSMNQAFSLINAGTQILTIDPWYCRLVSSRDATACVPNDGVVPAYSQAYPGAPNLVMYDGPAHKQEKQQSDDTFYTALVFYSKIPRRGAPPVTVPPPAEDLDDPDPTSDPDPVLITTGELRRSDELRPGDCVTSTSQRFHLCYQGDGNLVLYDTLSQPWQPLWASDTIGTSAGFAAMQGDGNFVVYDGDGVPRWASDDSLGHPDAWLAVQNDGNVVIYGPDGTPLWHTGTVLLL